MMLISPEGNNMINIIDNNYINELLAGADKALEEVKEAKKEIKADEFDFRVESENLNIIDYINSLTERNPINDKLYLNAEQAQQTIIKLAEVKELMKEANLDVKIAGRYIRVSGDTKIVKEQLKALQFQWRGGTGEWVFTAREYSRKPFYKKGSKTKMTKEMIYSTYGAVKVED